MNTKLTRRELAERDGLQVLRRDYAAAVYGGGVVYLVDTLAGRVVGAFGHEGAALALARDLVLCRLLERHTWLPPGAALSAAELIGRLRRLGTTDDRADAAAAAVASSQQDRLVAVVALALTGLGRRAARRAVIEAAAGVDSRALEAAVADARQLLGMAEVRRAHEPPEPRVRAARPPLRHQAA